MGYWPDSQPIKHDEKPQMIENIADDFGYVSRMTAGWGCRWKISGVLIVPAVWFWRADDPYYHSKFDTADMIDES